MRIRPMKPTETVAVTDIWESAVRATHHWYEPNTENVIAVFRQSILKFVTPNNTVVLEDNGQLVGMAAVHNNKVDMLFIDGKHLHKGYGTTLLNYMVHKKRSPSFGRVQTKHRRPSILCKTRIHQNHRPPRTGRKGLSLPRFKFGT